MFAGVNRFQPGKPRVNFAALKNEKTGTGRKFLPLLYRMLDCDYESRATVSEAMSFLIDELGDGPCFFSAEICQSKMEDFRDKVSPYYKKVIDRMYKKKLQDPTMRI